MKRGPSFNGLTSFALGVLLLSVGFIIWKQNFSNAEKTIGRLEVYKGSVLLKEHSEAESRSVDTEANLHSGSLIISAGDSDSVLNIQETRMRLKPDTQVFIEAIPPHIIVYLQKGSLEPELAIPDDSQVLVESGLQRVSAKKFFEQQNLNRASTHEPSTAKGPISQETIQLTLKKEQPLFFRCYTQLLQRSPKAKGEIELVFTILSSGKVGQPQVSGSQLKDEYFRKCLIDVISRTDFPRFEGVAVSTVFPLKFE